MNRTKTECYRQKCCNCGSESIRDMTDELDETSERKEHWAAWIVCDGWLELYGDPQKTGDADASFLYLCPDCMEALALELKAHTRSRRELA